VVLTCWLTMQVRSSFDLDVSCCSQMCLTLVIPISYRDHGARSYGRLGSKGL
jgi:hypothetical protein